MTILALSFASYLFALWKMPLLYLGLVLQCSYIISRGIELERLPLVGPHDTLVFLAASIAAFSIPFGYLLEKRKQFFNIVTVTAAVFTVFVMISKQHNSLLPPVLKTFWFEFHVVLAFMSYALFGITAILGYIYLNAQNPPVPPLSMDSAYEKAFNTKVPDYVRGGKQPPPTSTGTTTSNTDYVTDSSGNKYFKAHQDNVQPGQVRFQKPDKDNGPEFFLLDKDGTLVRAAQRQRFECPKSKFDKDGREYKPTADPKIYQRYNEEGKLANYIFNDDGTIQEEGALVPPSWMISKTPPKTELPNDKGLRAIHQRLISQGATDSEEMRQRLIQGYMDKKAGKTPSIFSQDEINFMEELTTRSQIADTQGTPRPGVQKQKLVQGRDPKKAGLGATLTIRVDVDSTQIPPGMSQEDWVAEEAVRKSGVYRVGREYDKLETKLILDQINGSARRGVAG